MISPSSNPPALDGSLEEWLVRQIGSNRDAFKNRTVLLDVGAYHGDFARGFLGLANSPFAEAILFEPNPENLKFLRQQLNGDKRFRLEACACDVRAGSATLYCQGELYTGSILPYQNTPAGNDLKKSENPVSVVVLDEFLAAASLQDRVGFIKVDTQGNDLRVLQGAAQTLRLSRPWLIVEMLATPRFVNQANPAAVIQWLEAHDYFLAAQFNEYYTDTGWLAWYDACFVPKELFRMDRLVNHVRPTAAAVRAEIQKSSKGFWRKWSEKAGSK